MGGCREFILTYVAGCVIMKREISLLLLLPASISGFRARSLLTESTARVGLRTTKISRWYRTRQGWGCRDGLKLDLHANAMHQPYGVHKRTDQRNKQEIMAEDGG